MKKAVIALMLAGLVGLAQAELVLYLPFDVDATDVSGQGNDGIFVGSAAVTAEAADVKLGAGSLTITDATVADGVKGTTDNGFSYGNDPWTLSAWVKTTDTHHCLVGYGKDVYPNSVGNNTNLYQRNESKYRGQQISHWGYHDLEVTPPDWQPWDDGDWHLATATYDGTTQTLYIDGQFVKATDSGTLSLEADPEAKWVVGKLIGDRYDNSQSLIGQIDDVAIWNHTLTAEEVALLWNKGDGMPANLLGARGAAHTPIPDGTSFVNSKNALDLTWQPTEDPNALNVEGYDLYFYGISNAAIASDPDLAEPNFVDQVVISVSLTGNSYTVNASDLDYEYTYFWRVDSTVQWDSAEITGTLTSVATGIPWSFKTIPENPAPIVVSDGDILTAMEFLDAGISAAVDDEDIDFIEWSIVQYPGTVSDTVSAAWTRKTTNQLSHDHDLLGDAIVTNDYDATGNPMRLIISGLDTGTYTWTSYHHDSYDLLSRFDVYIDDAAGRSSYPGYTVSLGDENSTDADVTKVIQKIESDGSDVVVIFYLQPSTDRKANYFPINALELAGSGGSLNIDFGPDGSPLKEGYQAYTAVTEDIESFNPVTYDAFGGTANVTVDAEWGLEEAGLLDATNAAVTDTTVDLSAPTATFSTDLAGTYIIELKVTDTGGQTDSAAIEIKVASDSCAAAQMAGDWRGFNYYDTDQDCDVDVSDFALFALEWLNDVNLTGQVLH